MGVEEVAPWRGEEVAHPSTPPRPIRARARAPEEAARAAVLEIRGTWGWIWVER